MWLLPCRVGKLPLQPVWLIIIGPTSTSNSPICHSRCVETSTDRGTPERKPHTAPRGVTRGKGRCAFPISIPRIDGLAEHKCGKGRTAPKEVPQEARHRVMTLGHGGELGDFYLQQCQGAASTKGPGNSVDAGQ